MSVEKLFRQDESWMAIDPVVGCINNCAYCFLKLYDRTPKKGKVLVSPEETLKLLSLKEDFDEDTILMLGSETDFFMNSSNIAYLSEFLKKYQENGFSNLLTLSTKCLVSKEFLKEIEYFPKDKLFFYLSYSGLGKEVEPRTKTEDLRQSFINIKEAGFPLVHYWRPFIPENSSEEAINDILDFVVNYADCSVCSGLKLNEGILKNMAPFWPQLLEQNFNFAQLASVWPKGIKNYIFKTAKEKHPSYPVFSLNSCALSYLQEKPEYLGMQNNENCLINLCPLEQRQICSNFIENRKINILEIKDTLKNWGLNENCYFATDEDSVIVEANLTHAQMIQLRRKFAIKFITAGQIYSENEWGGTAINKQELEI